IADQAAALDIMPDRVLVPASGGGLVAGIGLAIRQRMPSTTIHTVEPADFDDHARSFVSGQRERNSRLGGSICDALLAAEPGRLTFAINRHQITSGYAVEEDAVLVAIAFAFRELKLVVEPGGAVALAAILSGRVDTAGRTTVVVLSGGNIDAETLSRALASA
ncbi:MAG: pyridoxal-phosphate dependent enzyme, partial [Hyphomicrobiales bacterium]|nr:pyridoxal-phosphate dependent enzyme [Hyphomicrobiales bacterium]